MTTITTSRHAEYTCSRKHEDATISSCKIETPRKIDE